MSNKNTFKVGRNAKTGEFVSVEEAEREPELYVVETVERHVGMSLRDYQKESRKMAIYHEADNNFIYPTLGLVGEAGEVAEKVKKIIRKGDNSFTEDQVIEMEKELGDVLWYLAQLATELNLDLSDIAATNIQKLKSRMARGVLHKGEGDNR